MFIFIKISNQIYITHTKSSILLKQSSFKIKLFNKNWNNSIIYILSIITDYTKASTSLTCSCETLLDQSHPKNSNDLKEK
ncbi:hypothetical protein BpHYR1_015033 [Brachionus plicatilis]|uniref:Uncharacterized protein n=1 Tax=Brachionus plicatilis TaxID=10195 RepID=A0A3M7QI98_BRAPC|nr:hypothetical protein BpHYR1_015033 [Brachionus plicatilis]